MGDARQRGRRVTSRPALNDGSHGKQDSVEGHEAVTNSSAQRVETQQLLSCAVDVAPVHAEPRDDAEQVTQLLRGEPVRLKGRRRGDWEHVETMYDYGGWVRSEHLTPVPARTVRFLRPREGDPILQARQFTGAPYVWGGMTEKGIDCSGLVHMAYRRLGRLIPRDADQQELAGTPVDEKDARYGDVVTYGEGQATHIAFWLGNGRVLHATQREGVNAVLEEDEPEELRARRRQFVRF
jgi:gamma-D-glutamyl-L-lysine dipeptidyl-peptidase